MRLTCLQDGAEAPCLLLKVRKVQVLVDYGLDLDSSSRFLTQPDKREWRAWREKGCAPCRVVDIGGRTYLEGGPLYRAPGLDAVEVGDIHAVVITTPAGLLGLPYLVKDPEFTAHVYATEAALHIGRLRMQELLRLDAACRASSLAAPPSSAAAARLLGGVGGGGGGWGEFRDLYSEDEAAAALGRVAPLRYGQRVEVAGGTLVATPRPCGGTLGGAWWDIEGRGCKVGVMGPCTTLRPGPYAPLKLAHAAGHDAFVLSHSGPTSAPSGPGVGAKGGGAAAPVATIERLEGLAAAVLEAVKSGGCALLPVHPDGPALELLEALGKMMGDAQGNVPIYYVSPSSTELFAYATMSAEWLCGSRQRKAYLPEAPWGHAALLRDGRLAAAAALSGAPLQGKWVEPCVALVPAVSLNHGPAAQLMSRWRGNSRCLVGLTQHSAVATVEAVAPHQPLAMRVVHCEHRGLLGTKDTAKLLGEATPYNLLLPSPSLTALMDIPSDDRGTLATASVSGFSLGAVRRVPMPAPGRCAMLSAELAVQAKPVPVTGAGAARGLRAARMVAVLSMDKGGWTLDPPEETGQGMGEVASLRGLEKRRCVWGQPQVSHLVGALEKMGFGSVDVEAGGGDGGDTKRRKIPEGVMGDALDVVSLVVPGGSVHLAPNATHIEADDAVMRQKLLAAVTSLLRVL